MSPHHSEPHSPDCNTPPAAQGAAYCQPFSDAQERIAPLQRTLRLDEVAA